MLSAIDTNVISALWSKEPTSHAVATWLNEAREVGGLVISAPVHAELRAHPTADDAFVERFLKETDIRVDFALDENVWRSAGEAYAANATRRRSSGGGKPKRLLVDFLVGAHALFGADRLLTLDADRYRAAFPALTLVGSPGRG